MARKALTPEEKEICEQSLTVVRSLDTLAPLDEFKAFMARIKRRADQLADEVLHDEKLDTTEREKRRNQRTGLMEVLGIPKDDREASIRILAQYGISPGEPLDD